MKHFLFFLFVCISLHAEITPIHSFKECNFDECDENTLVIFDVDEVLIKTVDVYSHYHDLYGEYIKKSAQFTTPEGKDRFEKTVSLCYLKPQRILVEESTPKLIKELQEKGIKTIALTSCHTGSIGYIPSIERWRIDHLKSLDIDFSSSFNSLKRIDFVSKNNKTPPVFEDGILFSRNFTKGEVLESFLNFINWKPKKVIFFDDLIINHETVSDYLAKEGISFHGFHYLGGERELNEVIDTQIIKYQLEHLFLHQEWLTDEEVKNIIKIF